MSFYGRVPKTLAENLRFRRYLLAQAHNSPAKQAALRDACSKDILFYFNFAVWTFNPRLPDKAIPFITYDFQDEGILAMQEAIRNQEVMVIEKSRDMGASWMCCGVMDYEAQFVKDSKFLMMSRKADMVDALGDPDCLFWKIRFIHKWLPSWLLDVKTEINSRVLRIEYLRTGSFVTGAATTADAGVGGRATGVFVVEFSRFDPTHARMVKSGIADLSGCRIFNFTPSPEMGKSHPSYELVEQAQKGTIRSQRWHWRRHKEKAKGLYRVDPNTRKLEILDTNYEFPAKYKFQMDGEFEYHSPWFDKERIERGNDRDVREMLEIDYEGSSYTFFDTNQIRQYIQDCCRPPTLEGDLIFDPVTGKPDHFEVVQGGPIKLWTSLDNFGMPPKATYAAGADSSLGLGATNSVLSCARVDTGEKILEFATPFMKPDQFATKSVAICTWLYKAILCWEQRGPGDTFGEEVLRLRYSPIYTPDDKSKLGNKYGIRPGFNPGRMGIMLAQYRTALSKRDFLNRSKEAMLETMEWVNGPKGPVHKATLAVSRSTKTGTSMDPSGALDNHGDRCVADGICCLVIKERGGGSVQAAEPKALPGTFEYYFSRERELALKSDELYPNWEGNRRW